MQIVIRHVEPGDEVAIQRIMSGRQAVWGSLAMPYMPVDYFHRRTAMHDDTYGLVACVAGDVVGSLGLHLSQKPRRRHVASLGMAVRDDWQGQGIGTALLAAAIDLTDNWLNLTRLELHVWVDNAAAVALYTRAGFVIEGTCRQFAFRDGQYVDAYAMARLREPRPPVAPHAAPDEPSG
jgi:putative acetyltransferase